MSYLVDFGTPTVDLITVKILLIILVLTSNAKLMTMYVRYFYFNAPMARSEYICLKLSNLPESVVQQYNPEVKATKDGYIHVEIRHGMYGLPQANIIAQKLLKKRPNKKGYTHN